jgi:hypothetical protein
MEKIDSKKESWLQVQDCEKGYLGKSNENGCKVFTPGWTDTKTLSPMAKKP